MHVSPWSFGIASVVRGGSERQPNPRSPGVNLVPSTLQFFGHLRPDLDLLYALGLSAIVWLPLHDGNGK